MSKTLLEMTVELVSATISSRSIDAGKLADTLNEVFATLNQMNAGRYDAPPQATYAQPPSLGDNLEYFRQNPVESIQNDYIICLESGDRFRLLSNRHLKKYGLTPTAYKARWGFNKGQPLSCKSLTRRRKKTAIATGAGRQLAAWREDRKSIAETN